jgi:predicted N-acetyltransferase YhbS
MVDIRPLAQADLPEAARIIRLAFGAFLGAPQPETFWADRDYAYGRFGAEHTASFGAEESGALVGSNFATRWGSVGFFGPLTIRPDLWDSGIGQRLVDAACGAIADWGVSHAGLFTFAESAKHVWTYGKSGFYPRYLTAIMAAPARASAEQRWRRYAELPPAQRPQAEAAARELTQQLYEGLDLGGEIRTVLARNLGDTVLLWDGDSRLAGFAVCHWGPASEAGADTLFVKFGAARSGPGAGDRFAALLDATGALAMSVGMGKVLAGVNAGRADAYGGMHRRGFRAFHNVVTMHRPNEPGYSRPDVYALDDWR